MVAKLNPRPPEAGERTARGGHARHVWAAEQGDGSCHTIVSSPSCLTVKMMKTAEKTFHNQTPTLMMLRRSGERAREGFKRRSGEQGPPKGVYQVHLDPERGMRPVSRVRQINWLSDFGHPHSASMRTRPGPRALGPGPSPRKNRTGPFDAAAPCSYLKSSHEQKSSEPSDSKQQAGAKRSSF